MKELLNKIFTNTENDSLLNFLKIKNESNLVPSFMTWEESYSTFDEGGCVFFDNYGEFVADECKYSLDIHSVMANINTGEIFAFNTGRFSVFFKCNFEKAGVEKNEYLKKGYTFDCITDITELGGNWCFMDRFDNPKEQLKWSHEQTEE